MKKRIRQLILLTMVLVMLVSNLSVLAAAPPTVQPLYDNANSASASLTISSNGLASCYGKISLHSGCTAEVSLTLLRSTDKTSWSSVKTWNTSGASILKIDKPYFVASGYYYMVELDADIYNSRNIVIENITVSSSISAY